MTVPIRSMEELVEALRIAQIELSISYETIDAVSGLQPGYTAKLLAPTPIKNLGPVSTFPLIGALGKALVLVDDAEQIERVKGRWAKRHRTGGASMQMVARAKRECQAEEGPEIRAQLELKQRMQELGRKGGKRRLQTMSKRARQRVASHAARKRWAKRQ